MKYTFKNELQYRYNNLQSIKKGMESVRNDFFAHKHINCTSQLFFNAYQNKNNELYYVHNELQFDHNDLLSVHNDLYSEHGEMPFVHNNFLSSMTIWNLRTTNL